MKWDGRLPARLVWGICQFQSISLVRFCSLEDEGWGKSRAENSMPGAHQTTCCFFGKWICNVHTHPGVWSLNLSCLLGWYCVFIHLQINILQQTTCPSQAEWSSLMQKGKLFIARMKGWNLFRELCGWVWSIYLFQKVRSSPEWLELIHSLEQTSQVSICHLE